MVERLYLILGVCGYLTLRQLQFSSMLEWFCSSSGHSGGGMMGGGFGGRRLRRKEAGGGFGAN